MNKATGDRSTALPRPPYGVVQAATNFLEAYRKFGLARKHLPLTWQRLASSDPYRMNLSATTAARVVQVLRFLALIDEGGNRTPDFEAMDRSHNDATWRSILAAHVAAAYPAVFALLGTDLDRERVVAAFRLYDPPYERRKMASLFIELCELAGITNPQLAASMFAVPISTSEQASGPTDLQPANLALTLSEETAVVEERLPANDPPPAATQATPIPIVADPVFIAATGRSSAVPTALPAAATATVVGAAEASSTWSPLDPADLAAEKLEVAHRAAAAFAEYGLRVEGLDPSEAVVGPTLLRYYFRLAAKQKLPPLRATLPEIGLRVGRGGLMLTLVPEQGGLAFDVPRRDRYLAPFQDGIVHLPPVTSPEQLPFLIGVTPENQPLVGYLDRLPHLLIGGDSGSGKTTAQLALIASLVLRHTNPSDLHLFIASSKPMDFQPVAGLPHLAGQAIQSDVRAVATALVALVEAEFAERGRLLTEAGVANIAQYNRRRADRPLPPVVIIIGELADLADQFGSDRVGNREREAFYALLRRIAQVGRAYGVYLDLDTQQPRADIIPTNLRALLTGRIALHVDNADSSGVIIGQAGAEDLQKPGDLLYKDGNTMRRAQGYFLDAEGGELAAVLRQVGL